MIDFEPKYITFDCYGTLTKFRMADMAREMYGDRLQGAELEKFVAFFAGYRRDEVLGAWKPYRDVVVNSVRRACKRMGVEFNEAEAEKFYTAVPTWGPHPDVPEGLSRLAKKYKLVILSNASNNQIQSNVDKLGAPFHTVFTAQQAQSYKPRMQGFEYMFDQLNCNPGRRAACVVEPALRPDDRARHGHQAQGVRQARPRAVDAVLRVLRSRRHRRPRHAARTVSHSTPTLRDTDEARFLLARHRAAACRSVSEGPVEGHVDVAVIGGGFTGLSAALALAQARRVGGGARRGPHRRRRVGPQRRPVSTRASRRTTWRWSRNSASSVRAAVIARMRRRSIRSSG